MNTLSLKNLSAGLLTALLIMIGSSLSAQFSGGSGTKEDPWHVATATDLDNIRNYPDSSFIQVDNIDLFYWGDWVPINNFGGIYNGAYHSICNLNVTNQEYAGLFAYSTGDLVRVRMEFAQINGAGFTGGIVGLNDGYVLFCSIYNSTVSGSYFVGGIAGANDGTIMESYVHSVDVESWEFLGGISGDNYGIIKNSYTDLSTTITGYYYIGGMLGWNHSEVEHCYSTALVVPLGLPPPIPGDVTVDVEERLNAFARPSPTEVGYEGGLVGGNTGIVTNSYWDTETSGMQDSAGGEGRTTAEMTYPYDKDTYVDWDILYTWRKDKDYSVNDGYLYLRFQSPGDFAGGSGTEGDPFQVETAEHLNNVRDFLGSEHHFIQIADIDLGVPPWNQGEGWMPIGEGRGGREFIGIYDGNGHIINGLTIDRQNDWDIGLFGYTWLIRGDPNKRSRIMNLGVINVDITGFQYVGALIGYSHATDIYKCYSSGNIESTYEVGPYPCPNCHSFIGGLVGELRGGSITNSYSRCTVEGESGIGGLVGYASNSEIERCYSTGSIISDDPYNGYAGGLLGYIDQSDIQRSYWDTETSVINTSAGGEGRTTQQMTYPDYYYTYVNWSFCYDWCDDENYEINDGYPYLRLPKSDDFAGGLGTEQNPYQVSTVEHLNNVRYYLTEFNSKKFFLQTNNIDLDVSPWNENEGWIPIGERCSTYRFFGSYNGNGNTIKNLYISNTDPLEHCIGLFRKTSDAQISNLGLINVNITAAGLDVGALVGFARGVDSQIINCFSTGIVNGSEYVGGLVGTSNYSSINMCYSICSVSGNQGVGGLIGYNGGYVKNSYSLGNVSGEDKVGGLIGWNIYTVQNCYSTGEIIGNGYHVGGLIGNNEYSVSSCYWDTESSGQEGSAGGYGRKTVQMLQEGTFENWDFDNVWEIADYNPYIRKHYPTLQWQEGPSAYNRIDNAHVKVFRDRTCYWESFPRLEEQNDCQDSLAYTQELLEPFTDECIMNKVEGQCDENQQTLTMIWHEGDWTGQDVAFNGLDGFKLHLNDTDEYFLHVTGDKVYHYDPEYDVTPSPEIILYEDSENWVGYHMPQTRGFFDAFGDDLDDLYSVKAEYWSAYLCPVCQGIDPTGGSDPGIQGCGSCQDGWIIGYHDPEYGGGAVLEYGKMYKIKTDVDDDIPFRWFDPAEDPWWPIPDETHSYPLPPRPEYFTFNDGSVYESFFISEIENDEDVLEVAVYAGDTCVGASVFQGGYPLEILAYTQNSRYDDEISFAVMREGRSDEPQICRTVEVKDFHNDRYIPQELQPMQRDFTVVRLTGDGDDGRRRGKPAEPQIVLGQNYPNPMVLGAAAEKQRRQYRSASGTTTIPLYLSKETEITIDVFNIRGQKVDNVVSGKFSSGNHTFNWDGTDKSGRTAAAGIYFYRLESEEKVINRKMLLIR